MMADVKQAQNEGVAVDPTKCQSCTKLQEKMNKYKSKYNMEVEVRVYTEWMYLFNDNRFSCFVGE